MTWIANRPEHMPRLDADIRSRASRAIQQVVPYAQLEVSPMRNYYGIHRIRRQVSARMAREDIDDVDSQ